MMEKFRNLQTCSEVKNGVPHASGAFSKRVQSTRGGSRECNSLPQTATCCREELKI